MKSKKEGKENEGLRGSIGTYSGLIVDNAGWCVK